MQNELHVAAIAILLGLLLLAASLTQVSNQNHTSTTTITYTPGKYSQIFGVNVHTLYIAINISLGYGLRYFRTGIGLSQSQIQAVKYESQNYNAQYLGILGEPFLNNQTWNLSDWNSVVTRSVEDYPSISTWEIQNEPYTNPEGYNNGSVINEFNIIKSSSIIVKSIDPNATVICFGGAAITSQAEFDWYQQVWNMGASQYCDAVSIHAYTGGQRLLNSTISGGGTIAQNWTVWLNKWENMTGKPIWITETSTPSTALNEPKINFTNGLENQNEYLNQSFAFFSSFSYIPRVYWYDIWGYSDPPEYRDFGLLNSTTYRPNPAFYTFLSYYDSSASVK